MRQTTRNLIIEAKPTLFLYPLSFFAKRKEVWLKLGIRINKIVYFATFILFYIKLMMRPVGMDTIKY